MTESDLERLEAVHARAIGLVIAGARAGFFVREPDGSMQTIKSHQEFQVRAPASKPVRKKRVWMAAVAACVCLCTVLAWPSKAFGVEQRDGAFHIALYRRPAGARLEIVDGAERHSIAITPNLTSVVYASQSHDVRVRLIR